VQSLKTIFVVLFLLFASFTANAAIYQYIDKDGNVTYTDQPVQGAKRIKQIQLPVQKPVPAPPKTESRFNLLTNEKIAVPEKAKKAKPYTRVEITKPKDDEGVRGNNGDLFISVALMPALQTSFGHKIQLLFDGKKLPGSWQSNNIMLKEVYRGTHTLAAIVVDDKGKIVKQSKQITFHFLRHSILFKH